MESAEKFIVYPYRLIERKDPFANRLSNENITKDWNKKLANNNHGLLNSTSFSHDLEAKSPTIFMRNEGSTRARMLL